MKPQPQQQPSETVESLLRSAAPWHRRAQAAELRPDVMVIRARIQTLQRRLDGQSADRAVLDELRQIGDHLGDLLAHLDATTGPNPTRRQRLVPETEVVRMLRFLGLEPRLAGRGARPRVTMEPGLIGHTVLQAVLSHEQARACLVTLDRPLASVLSVLIEGPPAPRCPGVHPHLLAARLGADRLGGRLEIVARAVSLLEIPLEL